MLKFCGNCTSKIYIKPCRSKKFNYCSNHCQMVHQYSNGRKSNTSNANEFVRLHGFPERRGKAILHLHTPEINTKISLSKTGKRIPKLQKNNHWNWKGGVEKGIWFTWEYKQWRLAVFKRDNYTCQDCGDKTGGNLEAHHIKPKYLFPNLIFDINNGQTLCHDCHIRTPSYGLKVKSMQDEVF